MSNINYEKEIEDLKKEISEMKESFEQEVTQEAEELFGSKFDLDDLKKTAKKAGKSLREFLKDKKKELKSAKKSCEEYVKNEPVKSAIFAVGAGAVVALLINKLFNNGK